MTTKFTLAAAALALGLGSAATQAQTWAPTKNVEIVVGSAPGGSNDKTARTVEKIVGGKKLLPGTLTVVNKPGGGGNLQLTYMAQHAGDPHYLHGRHADAADEPHHRRQPARCTDFTPIASLFNDYVVFAVNADSPIKTGKDLVERLKKDPKSVIDRLLDRRSAATTTSPRGC